MKCPGGHGPRECKLDFANPETRPYCTNCETEGHPANFRNCPKFVEIKDRLKKKREDANNFKLIFFPCIIGSGISIGKVV